MIFILLSVEFWKRDNSPTNSHDFHGKLAHIISRPNRRLFKGYKHETALDRAGAVVVLYTAVIFIHVLKRRAVIKVQLRFWATNRLRLSHVVDCGASAVV